MRRNVASHGITTLLAWRYAFKGMVREMTNRLEMATLSYQSALDLDDRNTLWWYRLGRVQEKRRRWRAAAASYKSAMVRGRRGNRCEARLNRVESKAQRFLIHEFETYDDTGNLCPACGRSGPFWRTRYPTEDRLFEKARIVFCAQCGTGHVPSAASLIVGYYERDYAVCNRQDRDISPTTYFGEKSEQKFPELRHYFGRARFQVSALKGVGARFDRVLDYGAGPGYFLYVSGASQPYAVEPDSQSAKYLDYIGAERIEPSVLPVASFDVVVASHVVEHIPCEQIHDVLGVMIAALRPDGFLLIEVPNGGHLHLELNEDQAPHTLFYSAEGLRRILVNAGSEVVTTYVRGPALPRRTGQTIYSPSSKDDWTATQSDCLGIIVRRQIE